MRRFLKYIIPLLAGSLIAATTAAPTVAANQLPEPREIGEISFVSGGSKGFIPQSEGEVVLDAEVVESVADRLSVRAANRKVIVVAVEGWSGRVAFDFATVAGGQRTVVSLTVTVLPPTPQSVVYSPAGKVWSTVAWRGNAAASEGYVAYIGGRVFCRSSAESCLVEKSLSERNKVRVAALGGDGTRSWLSELAKPGRTGGAAVSTVYFGRESALIGSRARVALDRLVRFLIDIDAKSVTLYGYTDDSGFPQTAIGLSKWRNESVMHYLQQRVPNLKVAAHARGAANPKGSNATPWGRALNRRVVVVLGLK